MRIRINLVIPVSKTMRKAISWLNNNDEPATPQEVKEFLEKSMLTDLQTLVNKYEAWNESLLYDKE